VSSDRWMLRRMKTPRENMSHQQIKAELEELNTAEAKLVDIKEL